MPKEEKLFWDKVDREFPDGAQWCEVVGSDAVYLDERGPVTLSDGTEYKEIDGVWYRRNVLSLDCGPRSHRGGSTMSNENWIDQNYQIDRYGVALMMIREGCTDPAGLARRVLAEFGNSSPDADPVLSPQENADAT